MKGLHKKIIIISTEFPPGPGGIGSHAYSLTEALSNKGWEMDVFTCGDYSSKQTIVDFDRKQSFKIHRFRRKGWLTYFYRLYDVAHYIRKQGGGGKLLSYQENSLFGSGYGSDFVFSTETCIFSVSYTVPK